MSEELKPCPFCGGEWTMAQEPQDNHPVNGMWYLYHKQPRCKMSDTGRHFSSWEEAIAAWNTRAETPQSIPSGEREEIVAWDLKLRSMKEFPKNATWNAVLVEKGWNREWRIVHWADGDGDGLMPPFKGLFVSNGYGFHGFDPGDWNILGWIPMPQPEKAEAPPASEHLSTRQALVEGEGQ